MNETVIAIMAKQPLVGRTKTRLHPALTMQGAANLYEALLLDTIALAASQDWADLAVAITPPESHPYFESITPAGTLLLPVQGKDIGECLSQVMETLLGMGYLKALALNSDGPTLPAEYLNQAAGLLDQAEIVFGPNDDGGYYLVGMSQPHTSIFQDIAWSTGQVFTQTMDRAAESGLHAAFTAPWYDVDTPADLNRLIRELETTSPDRLQHTRRFLKGLSYVFPG